MEFKNFAQAKRTANVTYLGAINSSAKIVKNQKVSNNYTYIVYLSPAETSGFNVCSHSTEDCRMGCLANSGLAKVEDYANRTVIKTARLTRTNLFFKERDFFMAWLIAEIKSKQKKAIKDGYDFSVRLNGTSDINWLNVKYQGMNIFQIFPDILFYDYTKNPAIIKNAPANYHVTFSYTGHNHKTALDLLAKGKNVAVVFDIKKVSQLPQQFYGFPVINGDLTDFRPLDGNGVVVGLKWKVIANKDNENAVKSSAFVVSV